MWNYKLTMNNFCWYIFVKLLKQNVKNKENAVLKIQQKKIKNLTNNLTNSLTQRSCKKLIFKAFNHWRTGSLKFGLHHFLPPSRIYKANVFVLFEMMHIFSFENLKNEIDKPAVKSELLHLANSYVHNYKASRSKHESLKN